MRFEIIGKNITVTPAMKEKIEAKLSTLDKYLLIDPNTIARVEFCVLKSLMMISMLQLISLSISWKIRFVVKRQDYPEDTENILQHLLSLKILQKKKLRQFLLRQRQLQQILWILMKLSCRWN